MNQPQILGYMKDTSLLANAPSKELEHLVDEFPYCSVTRLLYTKALFDQKNIRYHEQLKKTAAHIPDRSILYWLINNKAIGQPVFDFPAITPSIISQTVISERRIPTSEQVFTSEQTKDQTDSYDGLMLRLNKLSELSFPWHETLNQKIQNLVNEHEKRLGGIQQEYLEKRLHAQVVQLIRKDMEVHTFPGEKSISPEENMGLTDTIQEESMVNAPETGVPAKPTKTDLIERFISETPGMPRPKKEFYNPVNMAHKSTIDTDDLVSETLAEVHLKQGNIPKALKIYERLYLIIPEKSAYFAARIENIKKENNVL